MVNGDGLLSPGSDTPLSSSTWPKASPSKWLDTEKRDLWVVAVNCGKACSDKHSQCALIDVVSSAESRWHVLYVCEFHAYRASRDPQLHEGRLQFRHWPGDGSFAMQFIIKNSIKHLVRNFRNVDWRGRCGALHLFQRGSAATMGVNMFLLAVHCSRGEYQFDTLGT